MDIPVENVQKLKTISRDPVSLETPVGRDAESALGDLIEDRSVGSPVDAINERNVRDETAGILKILSPREEKVPAALRHRLRASTPSKRSARSSMSRASGSGRSRPRRCGNSALPSGRGGCGP